MTLLHRLRALLLHHRSREGTVVVEGVSLQVPQGVLDPLRFRSGAWFAHQVATRLSASERPRLLDLGCGSGVVGLLAQRAGAAVTACDLNPAACDAARRNGLADVRQGDLFAPVQQERFDRICFNPPYFPGRPSARGLDLALYGGRRLEVVRRFLDGVPGHLSAEGRGWAVLSDRAPLAIDLFRAAGWVPIVTEAVADAQEVLGFWEWGKTG